MDQPNADDFLIVKNLYSELLNGSQLNFPADGVRLDAPEQRGVYVIYGQQGQVLHVGSTRTGQRGIAKRLRDHLSAASSFTIKHLHGDGSSLRSGCSYRYVVVENPRHRALLEAFAIGNLCPAHIGHGR